MHFTLIGGKICHLLYQGHFFIKVYYKGFIAHFPQDTIDWLPVEFQKYAPQTSQTSSQTK